MDQEPALVSCPLNRPRAQERLRVSHRTHGIWQFAEAPEARNLAICRSTESTEFGTLPKHTAMETAAQELCLGPGGARRPIQRNCTVLSRLCRALARVSVHRMHNDTRRKLPPSYKIIMQNAIWATACMANPPSALICYKVSVHCKKNRDKHKEAIQRENLENVCTQ